MSGWTRIASREENRRTLFAVEPNSRRLRALCGPTGATRRTRRTLALGWTCRTSWSGVEAHSFGGQRSLGSLTPLEGRFSVNRS